MSDQLGAELRILVTGAGGQLGQELVLLDVPGVEMIGFNRQVLNVTDPKNCMDIVSEYKPAIIIHTAAATAVDRQEEDDEFAWQANAEGTLNIARAAEAIGAKLCYISTDYVFDGLATQPYMENEKTAPQSVYGKTKLAGEKYALEACSKTFVVRTSWVYGQYGNNFVNTMLQFAKTQEELKVVNDQTGSPTYTLDLARFLVNLTSTELYGIYHASNSGECTWYEFACAIFEESGLAQQISVLPCKTEEFPRPAPRPAYSVLGHGALSRAGFEPMRHWRVALKDYLTNSTNGNKMNKGMNKSTPSTTQLP